MVPVDTITKAMMRLKAVCPRLNWMGGMAGRSVASFKNVCMV